MMPITDGERRRWQRNGAHALVEMLDAAEAAKLPPIHWRLDFTSTLVGMCLGDSPEAQRATFDAWARFLGAETSREEFGVTEFLRVEAKWADRVQVIVSARITIESGSGDPT